MPLSSRLDINLAHEYFVLEAENKKTTATTLPQIEERLSTYGAPHLYLYACWLLKVLMNRQNLTEGV